MQLPRTAAALGEALAVVVEQPSGRLAALSLAGRILGTDAGARRLFAVQPAHLEQVSEPQRRGAREREVRRGWQGADVERWLRVRIRAPTGARYVGTARRIFYRSNKHGGGLATYVHDFESPAPAVFRAGPNWFFVGGKKHITERGIEG